MCKLLGHFLSKLIVVSLSQFDMQTNPALSDSAEAPPREHTTSPASLAPPTEHASPTAASLATPIVKKSASSYQVKSDGAPSPSLLQ